MSTTQKITALAFDATGIDPQKPIEILPPGWYICEISDAEVKATRGKSGGTRANFEFTVIAGDFKGRKMFAGINTKNANPQAVEIGQRELSAICHATGIIVVTDLAAFIGKQLQVKAKTKKASDEDKEKGYEDRSEPSGYKPLEGAVSGPPSIPGVGAPPPPPGLPPAPPAPAAVFPPAPWQANPNAAGWFWNPQTNEQKQETELRAMFPAPAAPPAPPMPAAPPAVPTPPPAPVVTFPPAGWQAHPSAPGWFYETANPVNMLEEAPLRAAMGAPTAPAGPPMPPAPAAGSPPPWKQ